MSMSKVDVFRNRVLSSSFEEWPKVKIKAIKQFMGEQFH